MIPISALPPLLGVSERASILSGLLTYRDIPDQKALPQSSDVEQPTRNDLADASLDVLADMSINRVHSHDRRLRLIDRRPNSAYQIAFGSLYFLDVLD